MKNSPNREQMLFLIAGGIILVLILAVVVFNMIREPSRDIAAQPETRPVVSGVIPGQGSDSAKANEWVTTQRIAPAPVFANAAPEGAPKEGADKPAIEHESFSKNGPAKGEEAAPRPVRTPEPATDKNAKKEPPKAPAKETPKAPAKEPAKEPPKAPVKEAPTKESPKAPAKEPAKEPPKAPAKEAPTKESPKAPVKETGGKWALNLGAYSDPARADALLQKLKAGNMPVYLQKTKVGAKELTRVRAGPFATRAQAEEASRQAQKLAGVAGTVIAHGQ